MSQTEIWKRETLGWVRLHQLLSMVVFGDGDISKTLVAGLFAGCFSFGLNRKKPLRVWGEMVWGCASTPNSLSFRLFCELCMFPIILVWVYSQRNGLGVNFPKSMGNLHFAYPYLLLLLGFVPLLWWWRRKQEVEWHVRMRLADWPSEIKAGSWKGRFRDLLFYVRLLSLSLLLLALARPQYIQKKEKVKADGVDIMLVMDISSSMLSRDFKPDRLEASKLMAQHFADQRPYDRIGLVAFAGEAFTKSPLTTDKEVLKKFLGELSVGQLEDGTAIGMGLATAVNRLKDSQAKSKIIILLTDGVNNAGYIQPMTAAELAASMGIRVYTIGVGSTGMALTPVSRNLSGDYIFDYAPVEIDEGLLQRISELTGGRYFRATDEEALKRIYDEINLMEKTKIEVFSFTRRKEAFHPLVFMAILLLSLDFLLRQTLLRSVPT